MALAEAKALLRTFGAFEIVQVTPGMVQEAVDCAVLNKTSLRDALIIVSAGAAGCATLYSEDLGAAQTILGVEVVNPFADNRSNGPEQPVRGERTIRKILNHRVILPNDWANILRTPHWPGRRARRRRRVGPACRKRSGRASPQRTQRPGWSTTYWRDGDYEVDDVVAHGSNVWALEVKSGHAGKLSCLEYVREHHPKAKVWLIGAEGVKLEGFFARPALEWFAG